MADPLRKALRAQSTHRASKTRTYVHERLGLSKPGFWADWKYRRNGEDADGEEEDFSLPSIQQQEWDPTTPESKNYEWEQVQKRKPLEMDEMDMGSGGGGATTGRGSAAATKQFKTQLNAVVANSGKYLSQAHPIMSVSSSNLLAAEKVATSYALSQAFAIALQKDPHAMLNKVATEYYFNKVNAAAVARDNVPFGHGLPTQFEQMQSVLSKEKPKVKGNTKGVSVQQMQQQKIKQMPQLKTAVPNKPQLNVKQNGYSSSYAGFHW